METPPPIDPRRARLMAYINLKLAGLGLPVYRREATGLVELAREMLENHREMGRLLADHLPPADARIQAFLDDYLGDAGAPLPRLPAFTFVLDRPGMAREMSLPPHAHRHVTPDLTSYRVRNGILHNPARDRRTTEGVFHVAEGGLPVPPDKKAVPKAVFARLLAAAVDPPPDRLVLPFTADEDPPARAFVSLLLRPVVQPGLDGVLPERRMEIRFLAPGALVANLDFIESIFGNAGDPWIAGNDAALDPLGWTGHTGCVVLATHLTGLTKAALGLPAFEDATERQRRDGMCWKDPAERYNDGQPFKICARDERGVIVTLLADNYFGYSKKEVKAQVGYAANLLGLAEEEHAGGALVFPSYNHGTRFVPDLNLRSRGHDFEGAMALLGDGAVRHLDGWARDARFPEVVYLPEDAVLGLEDQCAHWVRDGVRRTRPLRPGEVYVHPTGYRVRMERHPGSGAWRLVGTAAEGLFCHKPCTVSGGGKSEISKSVWDAITFQPIVIGDYAVDLAAVRELVQRNYGDRFRDPARNLGPESRPVLSAERSLGSVIKLLSPSPAYTDAYNRWVRSVPERIKALVYLVKRFYLPEWGDDWERHFGVDVVNGTTGNLFNFEGRPLLGTYLRVGRNTGGQRWTFKMRQDVMPAEKVQMEDDITASVTVPADRVPGLPEGLPGTSVKLCRNVEARFFQRPDDAVHRGADKQAERDLARDDNFISNFEPLPREAAEAILARTVEFDGYTRPMQQFLQDTAGDEACQWFVASDRPRMVDGLPSKNPRYLQLDPGIVDPRSRYLADLGPRLYRRIPAGRPVPHPVGAVLPGRRLNPPDPAAGIRSLAVYGPVHYQELPELFMDFVCSLTGRSPSTTGAGSEGALTKGPFNALVATTDLNNALLSWILTGHGGFTTAAGHVGPRVQVDHDLSLLVPELWARLEPHERDPEWMKRRGHLERLEDFDHRGRRVPASRLGWRVTATFAAEVLGRLFDTPTAVFPDEVLRPELQDPDAFADGVWNIAEAQARVARSYLEDGSVEAAVPPLQALLHVMAEGHWQGRTAADPEVRAMFTREAVLASDWYRRRLDSCRDREAAHLRRCLQTLRGYLDLARRRDPGAVDPTLQRIAEAEARLAEVEGEAFPETLRGTLGLDPLFRGIG